MSGGYLTQSLQEIDPGVFELLSREKERQNNKIILIPSESRAPDAVLSALGSVFQNIYAEGYPDEDSRTLREEAILDIEERLSYYRRYSDPRYYKGVEFVDLVEALARRRTAEVFATNLLPADDIYVNVQPLSGAPANNAVYHALIQPGDTIMGMSLIHGGHLTHGSPVNRSGKIYNSTPYSVNAETEIIDYNQVRHLAEKHQPKIIVAGYSSYPWSVDWDEFRSIADSVGAFLLADISHVAGLVAGGCYPSPIGIADVVTFTTHKTLCGPRGACILTGDARLARKLDRAVFPGEQGGPHINTIAGIAVAMHLAKTREFRILQENIVKNCSIFTRQLMSAGFRIPYGGSDTHLLNLDCSSIKGKDGTGLSGDQAARILDIVGIVVNRNTIPGDQSAVDPSGIRMGTPWVTQIGFKSEEMIRLAEIVTRLLEGIEPYVLPGARGSKRRAKLSMELLEQAKIDVRDLLSTVSHPQTNRKYLLSSYHFRDDPYPGKTTSFTLSGELVKPFLIYLVHEDISSLENGEMIDVRMTIQDTEVNASLGKINSCTYSLVVSSNLGGKVRTWLVDLSDGYVCFDKDILMKLPGPVKVKLEPESKNVFQKVESSNSNRQKPFRIGFENHILDPGLSKNRFSPPGELPGKEDLRRTPLFDLNKELGAKLIPFAGWEMPVWYSSVIEEHNAVRNSAGVFDVAHMGVYQVDGEDAGTFLNFVCGNDIYSLKPGESCYTHLLTPDSAVLDDLLIYRRSLEKYLVVVNAANDNKDWQWLNQVSSGEVVISLRNPNAVLPIRHVRLRNLRDASQGDEMRVDIALQGPESINILQRLPFSIEDKMKLASIKRTELCEVKYKNMTLVISRTGYTGERVGFEIFIHPGLAKEIFQELLGVGSDLGLLPIGLGARDSLRIEAGLPLYGHEMGDGSGLGNYMDLGVGEAGFSSYVKLYKPWFIGRSEYIKNESSRKGEVKRFKYIDKGVRLSHQGDPVLDRRGKVIGYVTSCAVGVDGFAVGQAYLEDTSISTGSVISIYHRSFDNLEKNPSTLRINDRYILPGHAVIVDRFQK